MQEELAKECELRQQYKANIQRIDSELEYLETRKDGLQKEKETAIAAEFLRSAKASNDRIQKSMASILPFGTIDGPLIGKAALEAVKGRIIDGVDIASGEDVTVFYKPTDAGIDT